MPVRSGRWLLLALLIGIFLFLIHLDLGQWLTFDSLKREQVRLQGEVDKNPLSAVLLYFFSYVLFTALAVPGATIFTLAGGALFGLWGGTLLVSFASTVGATLAFLLTRHLFRDLVQRKFSQRISFINEGFQREGAFYLLTLRLVPVFPFFLVNLVCGLLPLRVGTYFWVSQLGMLPSTFLCVNAGTELAALQGVDEILSPPILISLGLIGLLPLVARSVLRRVRSSSGSDAN